MHDLEQALVTFNELDQTRAAAWRETAHVQRILQGLYLPGDLPLQVYRRKWGSPEIDVIFQLSENGPEIRFVASVTFEGDVNRLKKSLVMKSITTTVMIL